MKLKSIGKNRHIVTDGGITLLFPTIGMALTYIFSVAPETRAKM